MKQYLDITEVAKLVRQALRESFPSVKFSVRCDKYSGGSSMRIHWTDGPTARQVEAIANTFEGSYFDGMIDYKGSIYHTLDGEPVSFGGDFIFLNRDHSDALARRAIRALELKRAVNFDDFPNLLDKTVDELLNLYNLGELWPYTMPGAAGYDDNLQSLIRKETAKRCAAEYANALPSKTLARVEIAGSDGYGQSGIPSADGVEGKGYPNHEREPGGIAARQGDPAPRRRGVALMNHLEFAASESAALKPTDAERWLETVEYFVGHSLDGDQERNGYSIDGCFELYEQGMTPWQASRIINCRKQGIKHGLMEARA